MDEKSSINSLKPLIDMLYAIYKYIEKEKYIITRQIYKLLYYTWP